MDVLIFDKVFAGEVNEGLSAFPKHLPTRYLYDDNGTHLFEQIMKQPEYYLTRCERQIISNKLEIIADLVREKDFNLVELGAGNGSKTKLMLTHFLNRSIQFTYYPIDISQKALDNLENNLKPDLPELKYHGLLKEYFDGLNWLKQKDNKRNFVLFLGSNIGNLHHKELEQFLTELYDNLNQGDLIMIGFDLVKDYNVIESAYNDANEVTKAFTMNILNRINDELKGDFNLDEFSHYNYYNPVKQANEAYLFSKIDQKVFIEALEKSFSFKAFEAIEIEYSYKYTVEQIKGLASDYSFELVKNLFDLKRYFCDSIWRVNH